MPLAIGRVVSLGLITLLTGCLGTASEDGDLHLTSPGFDANGEIPSRYTCEGEDLSPPLEWSGLPAGTKSLVLIVEDLDAPGRSAVHWILYNIPASVTGLPESEGGRSLPAGARGGLNDFRRTQNGGPCPPSGRHRYSHKLFALDAVLPDLAAPLKRRLERALNGHVLGEAVLIGTYERRG